MFDSVLGHIENVPCSPAFNATGKYRDPLATIAQAITKYVGRLLLHCLTLLSVPFVSFINKYHK